MKRTTTTIRLRCSRHSPREVTTDKSGTSDDEIIPEIIHFFGISGENVVGSESEARTEDGTDPCLTLAAAA